MDNLSIVTGTGERADQPVLHLSASKTFAVASLKNSGLVGAMDVYHVGTGLRATPPKFQTKTRAKKSAVAFADFLDDMNPVTDDGTLRIEREEFHRLVTEYFGSKS